MSSAVTVLLPEFGCPEIMISFPSKFFQASLYFKFAGSASGSTVVLAGSGGGCPSRGTLVKSAIIDRRLVCAISLGSGPDAWGSKGPDGWTLIGWELLLAAEPTTGSTRVSCMGPTPETSLIKWVGITDGEPTPVASWGGLGGYRIV